MKSSLAEFLSDKQIKRFSQFNGLILIIFLIVSVWKWSSLPSQLPLFYSLPRSNDQLAAPFTLLILPLFAVLISIINFYLAFILYVKERLAGVFLTVMSAVASFLLLVTFIKIVFLVT